MQTFDGFTHDDFETFAIPTLDGRMEAIKAGPRPRLEALGRELSGRIAGLVEQPVYPIVAKHARRKVNPPNDTWVAWSTNPRGYKMLPHFQVGLWHTHAFIQGGVIYEARGKVEFGQALLADLAAVRACIPGHYRWLEDYTRPEGIRHDQMTDEDFRRIADRLIHRKEADCMVGLSLDRDEVVQAGAEFAEIAMAVIQQLMPIYRLATAVPVAR